MAGSPKKHSSVSRPYAKRSLGQNFLVDETYALRIVAALELSGLETVLEIGPGRGALTGLLAGKAGRVVGIEIDRDLVPVLKEQFSDKPSVEIVEGDILESDPSGFVGADHAKVVANLPYYISTAILRRLYDFRYLFSCIVVMLQKEVAERIVAPPGSSARGYLTVFTEHGFRCEKLFDVPPGAFRPVPKVESAVVRLYPLDDHSSKFDEEVFAELVSKGFGQKRKTLANNLKNVDAALKNRIESLGGSAKVLESAGITPNSRAEELSKEQWEDLARRLAGA